MTDEERQKRLVEMRELATLYREEDVSNAYPGISEELIWAANEIERLTKELEEAKRYDMWSAGEKTRADEIERLTCEVEKLWGFIRKYQNDVLVAERERDEVLCRLKGTMQ